MAGLPRQMVSVPYGGLNTKADPKGAPIGVLSTLENARITRRTASGFEIRKREGFSAVGGTSAPTKGVMGAGYRDELVVCDGLQLMAYSPTQAAWAVKGRCQSIACDLYTVSGNESPVSDPTGGAVPLSQRPNVAVAYQSGYTCHSVSFDGDDAATARDARVYVRDNATGSIVGAFALGGEYRLRLAAVGGSFFVFSWKPGTPHKIRARKISTATPSTITAAVDVATDANAGGIFAVGVDTAHSVTWVAYQNATPTLTILSWTTSNALGVSSTYAGVNPKYSIGFLSWDYSNSKGYVGVGALSGSNKEARIIEFATASGAETANTLLESTAGTFTIDQITGYRSSGGVLNAQWFVRITGSASPLFTVRAYSGGTLFYAVRGGSIVGEIFKVGTKWYLPVANGVDETGARTLLLELDENCTGVNGTMSWAGLLQNQDSVGTALSVSCIGGAAVLSSNVVMLALPSSLNRPASLDVASTQHYAALAARLDFSGAGLGKPVEFNGVLHVPGAAHKVYDGRSVVEASFYTDGLGVVGGTDADIGAAGFMTPLKTYQYCTTVTRLDAAGRLLRSTPSPVFTITMGGGGDPDANSVSGQVYAHGITESDPRYNVDQNVARLRIELWRTTGDGELFYLNQTLENDATASTINFDDVMADSDLEQSELLYTQTGELDNQAAPAVKVLQVHAGRLFALVGDGSGWHSKLTAEGFGTEMSDELRFLVDDGDGRPTATGSVDGSFIVWKRNRAYVIQGGGPDDKGNGPFPPAQRLSADLGSVSPVVGETPDGLVVRSAKGFAFLDRSLGLQLLEGAETFDGLVVTGAGPADGAGLVAFTTTDKLLVRDWQHGQWLEWTAATSGLAGVACFRWRTQLAILQADGTVKLQVAGQFNDGGAAIDMRVEFAWWNLGNARVYKLLARGDVVTSCTLSSTFSYDLDTSDTESKSIALTTGSKLPSVFVPNRGRVQSLRQLLHESSTTEGLRLTSLELEVGIRPGAAKHRAGQYAT
jgi:hypothetical protein